MWQLGGPWAHRLHRPRHFEPHGPCGGLARISKQLPLDAGAAAVAGRWVGKWPPGALGLFLVSTESSHTVVILYPDLGCFMENFDVPAFAGASIRDAQLFAGGLPSRI
jgi:hypothetical protein